MPSSPQMHMVTTPARFPGGQPTIACYSRDIVLMQRQEAAQIQADRVSGDARAGASGAEQVGRWLSLVSAALACWLALRPLRPSAGPHGRHGA
jgi:hypothetical protein